MNDLDEDISHEVWINKPKDVCVASAMDMAGNNVLVMVDSCAINWHCRFSKLIS
jgi:hypothetical protein